MTDSFTIAAETRDIIGKKVKTLRREGKVPAVIYGQEDSLPIVMDNLELARILRRAGSNTLLTIDLGDSERIVIVRDVQQHVTRHDLLHVDFYEVKAGEKLRTTVELNTIGQSPLVEDGEGVVTALVQEIEIECLPSALINVLEIDISVIDSPDVTLFVRDLVVPEGVDILTDPDTPIAAFSRFMEEEELEELLEEEQLVEYDPESVEVISEESEEEEEEESL